MNISTIKECTACFACMDRCPRRCITVEQDKLGHTHPLINTEACTHCGACLKVCPENNPAEQNAPTLVWAAWSKDKKKRIKSSSGALATICSEWVINNGGVVYGCAFNRPFNFQHIRCTALSELDSLKGSKYVQSSTVGVHKKVTNDLKGGKTVLFIGTPCQVAAVKRFTKNAANLITIDLICHGTPSVALLKDSLPQKVLDLPFDKVEFRKQTNYHFALKATESNAPVYERELQQDLFLKGFFTALFYRDSCYHCKYATTHRVSDITLGDFWGVDKSALPAGTKEGISLVMQNTPQGGKLLSHIKEDINYVERPITEAISGNKQLHHPMKKRVRAALFRKLYPLVGFNISVAFSIPEIILKNYIFTHLHLNRKQ